MSNRSSTSKVRWFYGTRKWRECSKDYMQSVGGLCERCYQNGTITAAALVHHIIPLTPENVNDPAIAYGWDNLEALCYKCHSEIHYGVKSSGRYSLDEFGRVIEMGDVT